MMNDSIAVNFVASRGVERTFLASAAFFALLILTFAGSGDWAPAARLLALEDSVIGEILYLAIFVLVFVASVRRRGFGATRAMPLLLGLLLIWCLASAYWAAAHGMAFRRAALEVMLTSSILLSADTLGPERAFRYWRIALAVFLLINWLSVTPHLQGALNPLAVDWHTQDSRHDAAGAVSLITALLFLFSRNGKFNWIGWLVAGAALGLLVVTHNGTALALFPVALLAGLAYRMAWRDGLSRAIFTAAAGLLLLAVGAWTLFHAGLPASLVGQDGMGRPNLFWAHPWLGAGYDTFGQGRNGYLQLLVSLGWVGFGLGIAGLIIEPLVRFWPLDFRDPDFRALLFALFALFVLDNFMQSHFLGREDGVWFSLLLVLTALRHPDKSLTLSP